MFLHVELIAWKFRIDTTLAFDGSSSGSFWCSNRQISCSTSGNSCKYEPKHCQVVRHPCDEGIRNWVLGRFAIGIFLDLIIKGPFQLFSSNSTQNHGLESEFNHVQSNQKIHLRNLTCSWSFGTELEPFGSIWYIVQTSIIHSLRQEHQ